MCVKQCSLVAILADFEPHARQYAGHPRDLEAPADICPGAFFARSLPRHNYEVLVVAPRCCPRMRLLPCEQWGSRARGAVKGQVVEI